MLTTLTLTNENQAAWDATVRQFSQHDCYYLSAYLQATRLPNQQPILFLYEAATFKAIHVAQLEDLLFDPKFTPSLVPRQAFRLTSGAGYGGFLFDGQPTLKQLAELERAYQKACLERHIVLERVRFHPTKADQTSHQFMYHLSQSTNAVALDLKQPLQFHSFQQALQAGIQISMRTDGQALEALYQIGKNTILSGPAECSCQLLGKFNRHLNGQFQVLLASYQNEVIAGGLVINTNHQLNAQLFGHQHHRLGNTAEDLLYFAAAEWGQEVCARTFFLGGGSANQINQQTKLNNTKIPAAVLSYGEKIFDQAEFNRLSVLTQLVRENSCQLHDAS